MSVDLGEALHGRVRAIMSSRQGGVSLPPYDSCNLGDHVQDAPAAVGANRQVLAACMQARPVWLSQVHGNGVLRLSQASGSLVALPVGGQIEGRSCLNVDPDSAGHAGGGGVQPEADGAVTTEPGLACTVMVADCLPVLLVAPMCRGVAALHAGWRGLAGVGAMAGLGIIHTGVQALCEAASADPSDLIAWLGPCIGPSQFQVGPEVLAGFGVDPRQAGGHAHFKSLGAAPIRPGGEPVPRWLADLPGLARGVLATLGVRQILGGQWCTVSEGSRFFSFRRDGITGRQAASICLL